MRFDVLEIEKLEEQRGADFPTEETAPLFYDTRAVSILDKISSLEGQLPKANLLKWMWTFNPLPLGTISVRDGWCSLESWSRNEECFFVYLIIVLRPSCHLCVECR